MNWRFWQRNSPPNPSLRLEYLPETGNVRIDFDWPDVNGQDKVRVAADLALMLFAFASGKLNPQVVRALLGSGQLKKDPEVASMAHLFFEKHLSADEDEDDIEPVVPAHSVFGPPEDD